MNAISKDVMQELIEQIMHSSHSMDSVYFPKNNQTGPFFSFIARAQCFLMLYVLLKNLPSL